MSKIKIGDTFFIKLNIEDILHVAYGVWNCKTFNDLTLKSEMFFESLSINNYHYSLLSKIDYDKWLFPIKYLGKCIVLDLLTNRKFLIHSSIKNNFVDSKDFVIDFCDSYADVRNGANYFNTLYSFSPHVFYSRNVINRINVSADLYGTPAKEATKKILSIIFLRESVLLFMSGKLYLWMRKI